MSDYDADFSDIGVEADVEFTENFWDELPVPLYWRVIVLPIKPKKVSSGGNVIPISAQEAQQHHNYMGKVVAIGDMAGKSERLGARGEARLERREDPHFVSSAHRPS
jgi:hypothetical protein